MPSTYTQNLGIEEPATGEQANTWGQTVNRNMRTLDLAVNGNTTMQVVTSPVNLVIDDGADSPAAANPVIIWNGGQSAQGTVHIDWQSTRKHLYIMSNQTTGGFAIAFAQGTGTQFVLQAGYDAILYADGGGPGANVAAALANPQFGNVLIQGGLAVQGSVSGNLNLLGSLGIGAPTSVPDALTINGTGTGGMGQLRLVEGNYGVYFRNDGAGNFFLMVTPVGSPYAAAGPLAFHVDLATGNMGIGAAASASYALTTVGLHASTLVVDNNVSAGGAATVGTLTVAGNAGVGGTLGVVGLLTAAGGVSVTGGGVSVTGSLTVSGVINTAGFHATGNIQVDGLLTCTANLQCDGRVNCTGTGYQFPDGTVQTTAAVTAPPLTLAPHYPSRNTNTVYTNTQGRVMFVTIMLNQFASSVTQVMIGTGGTASTPIGETTYGDGQYANFFFPVPAGYSWQITNSYGGNFAINYVVEWY